MLSLHFLSILEPLAHTQSHPLCRDGWSSAMWDVLVIHKNIPAIYKGDPVLNSPVVQSEAGFNNS